MFWGGLFGRKKTLLVRVERRLRADDYIEQVLEKHVVPLFAETRNGCNVYMHDNAPPHRANITRQYLINKNVVTMDWPAVNPDMNPVENLWSEMKRQLKKREFAPNADDLFETLLTIWEEFDEDFIKKHSDSMRKRVRVLH